MIDYGLKSRQQNQGNYDINSQGERLTYATYVSSLPYNVPAFRQAEQKNIPGWSAR
jgi:hypothetical protein